MTWCSEWTIKSWWTTPATLTLVTPSSLMKRMCFRDHLYIIKAIIAGEDVFSDFLLQQDSNLTWNCAALLGQLQDYTPLYRLLLVHAEMLSGVPARGTELQQWYIIVHRHAPCGTLWSLDNTSHCFLVFKNYHTDGTQQANPSPATYSSRTSLLSGHLLMSQQRSAFKTITSWTSTRIFSLSTLTASLLIKELVCSHNTYSLPCIQYALMINPWHHIQTVWQYKLRHVVEDIVELDQVKDAEALSGHTHATENHIYGLSMPGRCCRGCSFSVFEGKHVMARALPGSHRRMLCPLQSGKSNLKGWILVCNSEYNAWLGWTNIHIHIHMW